MDGFYFLLLFLAVVTGFACGRYLRWGRAGSTAEYSQLDHQYLATFNHLLQDRSDLAVEHFIENLSVNDQTLETHLAFGRMLRRKGEVDRAIRIHQNLLSRPSLRAAQLDQVHFELGKDYHQSGLLDRAEALFSQVASTAASDVKLKCYKALTDIYWLEQEWEKAISSAEMLCARRGAKEDNARWRKLQAFFCCELAEQALQQSNHSAFVKWSVKALEYDKSSLRAQALKFDIELGANNAKLAYKSLIALSSSQKAIPVLISRVDQYFANQAAAEKRLYLFDIYQQLGSERLLLPLADAIGNESGEESAVNFLVEEIEGFEPFRPLFKALSSINRSAIPFADLRQAVGEVVSPAFQCGHCGFEAGQFYWCCPTCKTLIE